MPDYTEHTFSYDCGPRVWLRVPAWVREVSVCLRPTGWAVSPEQQHG